MKNFIIFPFLLAFFPSWVIISKNFDELIFQDILISLAIVVVSVIVWIVITKIIKKGNKICRRKKIERLMRKFVITTF